MSSVPFFISLLLIVAASAHAQPPDPLGAARDLMVAGQWHEALEAYGEIIAKGETPAKAIAHNNSCVALNNLADYTAALEQCRAAIRLRRQLGDDARTARTLNNLAIALRYLGRFDEATLTYHEALAINQRLGDLEAQAINRQNLGAVEIEAGHYGAALATFAAVEALAADHSAEPWAERQAQLARFNRGVVLEKLGAYREALDLYRQLAADEAGLDAAHRVALRVNLGVIYRNLGDPVQAVSAFEAAAAEADTLGDTAALSNALLNLGLAWHLNLGQAEKAENAYRGALELARQSGDRSEEIQDLFYLGRLLRESGRLAEAQKFFQRCLEVSDAAGSAEGRWSALAGLGRSANDDGHPHDALRYLQQAIEQIETVRASLDGGALRSGYFGDKRPVYAAAIDILTELDDAEPGQGHLEQALELVQRTKARELLDSLGTPRRARDTGGVPQPLIAEDLRRLVTAGGPVLEYFLGESALYLWVIREQSIRLHRLGDGQAIFEEAATVHRTLASRQAPLDERLRRLARALLPDSTIEAHDSSLRIAPDGALHYLPFEILPSPVGDLPAPLVERFEITYLPSASALGRLDNEGPSSDWLFAGFGDPEPIAARSRDGQRLAHLVDGFDLPALPASRRELATIHRLLGGDGEVRLGGEATEAALRFAADRGARILHLATHTVVDERPGQGAAILLTAADDDDGLLRPAEIAELELRTDLTVLAACRSALGGSENGRAFASLTGSLLAAGSSAVVASLWNVDDEASAAFMEQFYYQISRGETPAAALRKAKLRLRADPTWDRPELWGAFILIGEAPRLLPAWRIPPGSWLAAVLILGFGVARWRHNRSRDSLPT